MKIKIVWAMMVLTILMTPNSFAQTSAESDRLSLLDRNRKVTLRMEAMGRLADRSLVGSEKLLRDILVDTKEPMALRNMAADLFTKLLEQFAISFYQDRFAERDGDIFLRKIALLHLKKLQPSTVSKMAYKILLDPTEVPDLRLYAIGFLENGTLDQNQAARNIVENKSESANLRGAILEWFEFKGEATAIRPLYRAMLSDPKENDDLRIKVMEAAVHALDLPAIAVMESLASSQQESAKIRDWAKVYLQELGF